jgi:16S rRNA processing protein RimM
VGDRPNYATLARVLRPRGVRGEVAAEILTDFPERLSTLRDVYLSDGVLPPHRARILRVWLSSSHGGQAIFHFAGCDSIAAAEKLRGLEIQVPIAERAPLLPRRHYVTDLIGCEVLQKGPTDADAMLLGVVRDVQFTGQAVAGTPLLVVERARGPSPEHQEDLLIPLAEQICTRIDTAAGVIEVVLPEGLLGLNEGPDH